LVAPDADLSDFGETLAGLDDITGLLIFDTALFHVDVPQVNYVRDQN
tara:strand:- start:35 stop:175 length:141 start_codon:yes stop_codon:yes gene_type:complete